MKRNIIVLLTAFASSLLGVLTPQAAVGPLVYVPTASIMVQLLFCFLSTSDPATPLPFASLKALPKFLAFKMLVVPLLLPLQKNNFGGNIGWSNWVTSAMNIKIPATT